MTDLELELLGVARAFDADHVDEDTRTEVASWLRTQGAFAIGLATALLRRPVRCACCRHHTRARSRAKEIN